MRQNSQNQWLRFMGLASQMIAIIVLGAFVGNWLDGYFGYKTAYFTAALSLLGVFLSFFYVFRDLNKGTRDK